MMQERAYIRLGDLPPDGHSSYSSGRFEVAECLKEPGVSVFKGWRAPGGYVVDTGQGKHSAIVSGFWYWATVERRPVYEAFGRLVEDDPLGLGDAVLTDVTLRPIPPDVPVTLDIPHRGVDRWNRDRTGAAMPTSEMEFVVHPKDNPQDFD